MDMEELYGLLKAKEKDFRENYLAGVTIDCVVFGYYNRELKVLLTSLLGKDKWMLPGGFVRKDLPLDEAAIAILEERTGVTDIFLQQFKAFGEVDRSEDAFSDMPEGLWFKERFVSIGYYSVVSYHEVNPVADDFSSACEWRSLENLPELMMDHEHILGDALLHLRRDLNDKPVGMNLLPDKFTMPELQRLYEIILGRKLNRGNFYRKMLRYGILTKLDETRKGGAHKSPELDSFDQTAYTNALENGLQESW
ncbi:MAG: NUDIX domain-containing protein [Cyclobacteriaceae bacterium]